MEKVPDVGSLQVRSFLFRSLAWWTVDVESLLSNPQNLLHLRVSIRQVSLGRAQGILGRIQVSPQPSILRICFWAYDNVTCGISFTDPMPTIRLFLGTTCLKKLINKLIKEYKILKD